MGGKGSGRRTTTTSHGTTACYVRGCRRRPCRAAWAEYMRQYRGTSAQRPAAYYGGRAEPVTLRLTALGRRIMEAAQARTGHTRGDVIEHLLRTAGDRVEFAGESA